MGWMSAKVRRPVSVAGRSLRWRVVAAAWPFVLCLLNVRPDVLIATEKTAPEWSDGNAKCLFGFLVIAGLHRHF